MSEFNQQSQNVDKPDDIEDVGDKVGGDKINVGDIEDSRAVAIGEGARATNITNIENVEDPGAPGWWKKLRENRIYFYATLISGFIVSVLMLLSAITAFGASFQDAFQAVKEIGLLSPSCVSDPAAEGIALILIFAIDVAENVPDSKAHDSIYEKIEEKKEENDLGYVRVEIDPNVILKLSEDEKAQDFGERCNAAVVIWGEETRNAVKVNFLNIKKPKSPTRVKAKAPGTLVGADFTDVYMPEQLAFLSLFAIGQAVAAEGEFTEAVSILEAAVENVSEELITAESASPEPAAAAYFWLGWLYQGPLSHSDEALDEAKKNYSECITLKPDYAEAYYNRGIAHSMSENYEEARDDYTQAINNNPEFAYAYYNRAVAYVDLEDYENAEKDYLRSLRLDPDDADFHNNLAWLYADTLGINLEEAIEHAMNAVRLAEEQEMDSDALAEYLDTLGWAYFKKGEIEMAKQYLEEACDLAPSKEEICDRLKIAQAINEEEPHE